MFYFYYLPHHHTEGSLGLFALILNLVVVFLVDGRIKELVQQFTGLAGLLQAVIAHAHLVVQFIDVGFLRILHTFLVGRDHSCPYCNKPLPIGG